MLILSANSLGLTSKQIEQQASFTFNGQEFSLFRSHQSRYAAIATCRKFLEQGGLALVVMHDHEDDNSVWKLSADGDQKSGSHQITMGEVMSRTWSILNTRVF